MIPPNDLRSHWNVLVNAQQFLLVRDKVLGQGRARFQTRSLYLERVIKVWWWCPVEKTGFGLLI